MFLPSRILERAKVEDISTLANGDKILIYGAGSNTVAMPYMLPGRNNVLSASPVEEAYFVGILFFNNKEQFSGQNITLDDW